MSTADAQGQLPLLSLNAFMMVVLYNLFESVVVIFPYQENMRIHTKRTSESSSCTSNSKWNSVNHILLTYFLNCKWHQILEEIKWQNAARERSKRTKQATERIKRTKQGPRESIKLRWWKKERRSKLCEQRISNAMTKQNNVFTAYQMHIAQ